MTTRTPTAIAQESVAAPSSSTRVLATANALPTLDAQLRLDCLHVINTLGRHPDVHVLVDQGWVTLRGGVARGADRWILEDAVSRVIGVVGARAQLVVCSTASLQTDDGRS